MNNYARSDCSNVKYLRTYFIEALGETSMTLRTKVCALHRLKGILIDGVWQWVHMYSFDMDR